MRSSRAGRPPRGGRPRLRFRRDAVGLLATFGVGRGPVHDPGVGQSLFCRGPEHGVSSARARFLPHAVE